MTILRQIELSDATELYLQLSNPCVSRYSRLKPSSIKDMEEMIMYLQHEELEQRIIPRAIINEDNVLVGMITLWDYSCFRQEGFLATIIGETYWGRGYNQLAKQLFFEEVFNLQKLNQIYLLVRNYNERSIAACRKNQLIYQTNFIEEMELREFYKDKIKEDHTIFYVKKEDYIIKEASL